VTDITPDELLVFSIARKIQNGDVVVQGLATPLVAAGLLLAMRTHAPNIYFASAIGQGICISTVPMGVIRLEQFWLERNIKHISFAQVACEFLPWLMPKEFYRPAQIDSKGNFNNIAFGKDYFKPRLRLPGSGGIPDMTTFSIRNYIYVPRHSRVTFVPEIDFCSGLGHSTERVSGSGPVELISDLGCFDFFEGKIRLISTHPGITINQIQSKTGFPLEIAPEIADTPLPSELEIRLLRNEIDPMGIRRLEFLGGSSRRELLHQIIHNETNLIGVE